MNDRTRTFAATAILMSLALPLMANAAPAQQEQQQAQSQATRAKTAATATMVAQSTVTTPRAIDTAIANLDATASALSRIARIDASNIRVTSLDDLVGNDDAKVEVLTRIHESAPVVANLHGSLNALTVTDGTQATASSMPTYLSTQGIDESRVVAALLAPSGVLTIYYQ